MAKELADPFGQQVLDYLNGKENYLIIERDDGLIEISPGNLYCSGYFDWPKAEQQAMSFAKGRVLDIGCGPGRHALYLQQQGHEVTAVDSSPLAIVACERQGIQDIVVGEIGKIEKLVDGKYETVLLLGNNVGLLQNAKKAPELLKKLRKVTSKNGVMILESCNPYLIDDPVYKAYYTHNAKKGKLPGESRIRIRYRNIIGPWFDYLYLSPNELKDILAGAGWKLTKVFESKPQYFAIAEKL